MGCAYGWCAAKTMMRCNDEKYKKCDECRSEKRFSFQRLSIQSAKLPVALM